MQKIFLICWDMRDFWKVRALIGINFSGITSFCVWMSKFGSILLFYPLIVSMGMISLIKSKCISIDTLNHLNSFNIYSLFIFHIINNWIDALFGFLNFMIVLWRWSHFGRLFLILVWRPILKLRLLGCLWWIFMN